MSKSGQTKNKPEENNKTKYFFWSDDEVELLLDVTIIEFLDIELWII